MGIPKITHQTAPSHDLSPLCASLRQRLCELHSGWEHRFYTDNECRELIRHELPHLLPAFDGYATGIQRADLFRVAAVYVYGGFYLDVDIECHASLAALCAHRCVLGEEKTLSPEEAARLGHRNALRVANYMFASEPGHPFWLDVLEEMLKQAQRNINSETDILESTGPGLVTDVYHRVKALHPDILLLRNDRLRCRSCGAISCQFGDYASHYHMGSWRWEHMPSAVSKPKANGQFSGHEGGEHTVELGREPEALTELCLVLKTYSETERDGLTSVYAMTSRLGTPVEDTRHLSGCHVLVPGIPFLYLDRLSPRNTNIVFTTFESTQLPRHWVDGINAYYHRCVVPHEAVKQVFSASGVRIPLHVISQGFTRHRRDPESASPRDVFRVGFIGVPVKRKNLRKLYDACRELLDEIPSLRLAVHVSDYYDWLDRSEWDDVKAAPFVEWSEGVISRVEVAAWYQRLSCYAYPSSAEGWSFTPRESMFLGIPTILTAIPTHAELAGSGFCTVIPVDGLEPAAFEGGAFGHWGRIQTDDIKHALAEVSRDFDAALQKARLGAKWIEDKWLNEDTLLAIEDLIRSL